MLPARVESLIIPKKAFSPLANEGATFPVPLGAEFASIYYSRDGWPVAAGETVKALVDVSLDGGNTWQFLCGMGARGGVTVFNGRPVLETVHNVHNIPEPNNPNRFMRVRITARVVFTSEVKVVFA